jgi:hypothetical protein
MAQGKTTSETIIPTMVRLPEELHMVCRVYAAQRRLSVSAQLVLIIKDWVNEQKDKAFLSAAGPPLQEGETPCANVALTP